MQAAPSQGVGSGNTFLRHLLLPVPCTGTCLGSGDLGKEQWSSGVDGGY